MEKRTGVAIIIVIAWMVVGYLLGQFTGGETALLGGVIGCLVLLWAK